MSDSALPIPQMPVAAPAPALPLAAGTATPEKLKAAAKNFEAIFLRQILAEAHKAHVDGALFSSQASDTFTTMQDAKFADIAAGRDVLGLARMIENLLGQRLAASTAGGAAGTTGGAA